MCTVLLPPGVNSIAVHKYININILWDKQRVSFTFEPQELATCLANKGSPFQLFQAVKSLPVSSNLSNPIIVTFIH